MSVIHPPRRLLFGPGPSQVEPRVYQAMAQPIVGLLDPYFFGIVEEIRKDLRVLFGTQNTFAHVLSGTGSSGMESALANFVEPGQKLVVFSAGYFGERIVEMGRRHGANVFVCQKPWGETFTEAQAWEVLGRENPHAVAFVHAETSTGALQEPKAITAAAHGCSAITIMDCVTSLGAMPINIDASAVDVAFGCTQKGLSCPPGLSPITLSPAAVERLRARKTPCPIWYLDLKLILDYYEGAHRYHHTAPVSSFYALREGLAAIREEGAEARFARHQRAHQEFVRRVEAINLSMFIPECARRITSLNTVCVPEGVDDVNTRKRLIAEFGIEIGGGFGPLAGKIFRIGLMGPLATEDNAAMFVGALVHCLRE
jgi:alanine-glyoxylate transaminase / serine-glyoxylate transaminase / serine-pyruvate transaminase